MMMPHGAPLRRKNYIQIFSCLYEIRIYNTFISYDKLQWSSMNEIVQTDIQILQDNYNP